MSFKVCTTNNKHGGARPPSLVSCLRYRLFSSSKTSLLQAISNQKPFLNRSRKNVKENCACVVDVVIDSTDYLSKKTKGKNYYNTNTSTNNNGENKATTTTTTIMIFFFKEI